MTRKTKMYVLAVGMLFVVGLILVACQTNAPVAPTQGVPPTETAVACPVCPTPEPTLPNPLSSFDDAWKQSGHADATAEAFVHWNETDDKVVPVECATCHSTPGYQDFLAADGSAAGVVDKPAPLGTTVTCAACHNSGASALTSVKFLSGVELTGLGPEARCMVCHQGRATMVQVNEQIEKFSATDKPDDVVAPIQNGDKTTAFGFINVHYYAAAITLYGDQVKGGYEYEGKTYDPKYQHVPGYDTCIGCHDPHTTQVKVDQCAQCHEDVKTTDDLKNIRMVSSTPDYNGNGNIEEGMSAEIAGLRDILFKSIQTYATSESKASILYDPATYPYFMLDKDNDGKADTNDKGSPVAYNAWTPRLLKAAYNYQISVKDPGAYAHGNKYIVQLLYDSIEDLNDGLSSKVDMASLRRDDAGHFAGNTMAFRDWDADGEVPGTCARCHSAEGLPQFIKEGAVVSHAPANGFQCSTCHDEANWPANYKVDSVTFPSGVAVTFGEGAPDNLCIECHQGRESTVSVTKAMTGLPPDTPSDKIRFRNIHYFAAGATLFGTEVKGIYEYPNRQYAAKFEHDGKLNTCTSCHDAHALAPDTQKCADCHQVTDPADIRMNSKGDYDGDGNTDEGLKGEIETYQEKLYAGLQAYATNVSKVGLVYNGNAYPYFFVDADGDGNADKDDKGASISYNAWTPRLLEAAYNYQYSVKDPGAYVHNAKYVLQALYDSLADLRTRVPTIDMQGMSRAQ